MSEFTIETIDAQPSLEITGRIPLWRIPKLLGDAYPRIKTHVESQGGTLAGPPYARYLEVDWDSIRSDGPLAQLWKLLTGRIEIRAGFPTTGPIAATDGMRETEFAPGRCVVGTHRGPYHKVGETYRRLAEWALENGVRLADSTWECYVNDPGEVAAEEIETRVHVSISG